MLTTRVRAGVVAVVVISLVFAALATVVSSFDVLVDRWAPQISSPTRVALRIPFHASITQTTEHGEASLVAIRQGRVIVPPYAVLDESDSAHREAFAYESLRRPVRWATIGSMGFVYFTLSLVFLAYIQKLGQNRLRLLRTQLGLFVLVLLLLAGTKAMLLFTALPDVWAPVAIVPLWIALAFDRRSALLLNIVTAFVASSLLRFDLMFLTVVLVRGMISILFVVNRRRPRNLILTGALAGLGSALLYMALATILEGAYHPMADLASPERSYLIGCVGGGALAGLIATVLRDPVERLLGQVPRDKLLDLTDIEQPLLKRLANEAPGTWEHSRSMANLAEAAAAAIGADSLLTRVGAYYHDVGKTVQAKYFVENLQPDEPSPHESLPPEVSADAIMAHVVLGAKILREHGIPEPLVEFVYTHHGNQLVEYFWHKYSEQNPSPERAEDHFRYPGMKPQTKETAILMLVDSIEAASRTVSPPTAQKFEEMIRRVIFTKLSAGELDHSGLTVEDLHTVSARMVTALVNMFHGRLKYPWQRQSEPRPAQSFTTPNPRDVAPLLPAPPQPPEDPPSEPVPTTLPSHAPDR